MPTDFSDSLTNRKFIILRKKGDCNATITEGTDFGVDTKMQTQLLLLYGRRTLALQWPSLPMRNQEGCCYKEGIIFLSSELISKKFSLTRTTEATPKGCLSLFAR